MKNDGRSIEALLKNLDGNFSELLVLDNGASLELEQLENAASRLHLLVGAACVCFCCEEAAQAQESDASVDGTAARVFDDEIERVCSMFQRSIP